ncbi:50S ribosomal protein L6 [Patescibacteria group bacterium]
MSRIGKLPIEIPSGVTVEMKDGMCVVKGPNGTLQERIHERITVEIGEKEVVVKRSDEENFSRSLHGLSRNLIANMVEGVTKGYEKRLEIIGVGYKAQPSGSKVTLNLGFSHPIEYVAPEGIKFELDKDKKNILIVSGISKQMVGEAAAKVRSYRKPEPYKGKGIRYEGEYVPRKTGKAVAKGE